MTGADELVLTDLDLLALVSASEPVLAVPPRSFRGVYLNSRAHSILRVSAPVPSVLAPGLVARDGGLLLAQINATTGEVEWTTTVALERQPAFDD